MGVRGREVDNVYWAFLSSVGGRRVVEAAHAPGDIMLVAWVVIGRH